MNFLVALFLLFFVVSELRETPSLRLDVSQSGPPAEQSGTGDQSVARSEEACRFREGPVKQKQLTARSASLEGDATDQDIDSSESAVRPPSPAQKDRDAKDEPGPPEESNSPSSAN